jgi:hypothetical protein
MSVFAVGALPAVAETPNEIRADLEGAARRADSRFTGFSANRGRAFFASRHGGDWSCASCHTEDPLAAGRHAETGKRIKPLAPAANPKRFSDAAKVQKWFDRNCGDVLKRACTAQEKGDVLEYLLSVAR